jgi:hypothetical protein
MNSSSSSSSLASDEARFNVAFDNIIMTYTLESDVNISSDDEDQADNVKDNHDDAEIDDHDELNKQAQAANVSILSSLNLNFSDKEMYYLFRGVTKFGEENWPTIYDKYKNKFSSDKTPNALQLRYAQIKNSKYSKLLFKHIFH